MKLLDRKGIVITGSGRGLGRSFAIAAAREGALVVVNDVDFEEAEKVVAEIEAEGGRAISSGASVAGWDSAGELIATCVNEFGAIDGLVNNAVAYTHFGEPWQESPDNIRKALEVNILGVTFCGIHAMRHMLERGRGSIVNVTSRTMAGRRGMATYCMAKGAVASLTYGWALDLAERNIRVNALSPSAATRGRQLAGEMSPYQAEDSDSPDFVAPAVVFLLSDLAAGIQGQVLALRRGKLDLMRPPGDLGLSEERPEWTAEAIADQFDRVYRAHLQPVGVQ